MNSVQTVRTIIVYNNLLLLLQKGQNSKNPNAFEFPGGKVDSNAYSLTDQILSKAASRELYEETQIIYQSDELIKIDYSYAYCFKFDNLEYERDVTFFCATLTAPVVPQINKTLRESGDLEDNHADYKWMSLELYENFARTGGLNPNSYLPSKILENCIGQAYT